MRAGSLSEINSERSNSLLVYLTIFISLADQRGTTIKNVIAKLVAVSLAKRQT